MAVCLLVGTNAWAVDYLTTNTGVVGAADNSSGFNTKGSKSMSLAAGDEYVITFVNNNKGASGTDYWDNWAFCSNVFNCRADHGASNPYWGDATNVNYTGNSWTDISSTISEWLQAYNGVTVTLTVSRNAVGDGITISHTATTKAVNTIASQTYEGIFTATVGASAEINFYLTCEDSHLSIIKVVKNGAQFSYLSSESAYTDQSNSTTNYDGVSVDNLKLYYTQYRDWGSSDGTVKVNGSGKISFYKFDLTEIKNKLATDGGTITGVTFSVYGNGDGGDCGKVRILGYNPVWSSSTITNATVTNNAGTIPGTVSGTGSFQPLNTTSEMTLPGAGTTLTANALAYVNSAIAADQDYVTIAMTANYTRTGLLKTGANLEFTYAAATLYEASFVETNSLNPTVTVYTDAEKMSPIDKNALEANTTYYYRAVLAGYNDYEGSFDVETSNPVVNFTMTAKPRYTFTVNAMNKANSATIKALFTDDDSYEGKTYTVYFPAYLTSEGNVVTYSKDNNTFYTNYTSAPAAATKTVSYNAYDGNAWFYEGEEVEGATVYTTSTFAGRSSNGKTGVLSGKTITSLDAGAYRITARSIGKADNTHSLYKGSLSGEKIMDITTSTSGAIVSSDITLDAATDIVANGGYSTTSDNGHGFDYFLIEKITSVSKTISSVGYATFSSTYALDLDNIENAKAYIVTNKSGNSIKLQEVTGKVAAGTGLILKSNEGGAANVTIPVTNETGEYYTKDTNPTNYLFAINSSYNLGTPDEGTHYVLTVQDEKVVFAPIGSTTAAVEAGQAALWIPESAGPAKALTLSFADDITGINEVGTIEPKAGKIYYNLQGQRVSEPKEGIYVVEGKKVLVNKMSH